jgi:hypothetical protein
VEDVSSRDKYCKDKHPRGNHEKKIVDQSGETQSEEPYLENFNLSTPPLMSGEKTHRQKLGRISIIVDDVIFINLEMGSPPLSTQARLALSLSLSDLFYLP